MFYEYLILSGSIMDMETTSLDQTIFDFSPNGASLVEIVINKIDVLMLWDKSVTSETHILLVSYFKLLYYFWPNPVRLSNRR